MLRWCFLELKHCVIYLKELDDQLQIKTKLIFFNIKWNPTITATVGKRKNNIAGGVIQSKSENQDNSTNKTITDRRLRSSTLIL